MHHELRDCVLDLLWKTNPTFKDGRIITVIEDRLEDRLVITFDDESQETILFDKS